MKYPKNLKSELTKKIASVFQYTTLGIGITIIVTSLGFGINVINDNDVSNEKDISGWVSLIVGSGIGIGISFTLYFMQQNQTAQIETQNKEIEKIVKEVHTVSDYLEKRLKGKERYTAFILDNRLELIIGELNHQLSLYEKWKIESDLTKKENFGKSITRSYDRCFQFINTGLSPIELRDIFEDHLSGMIQTAQNKLSISSDIYFDFGLIDETTLSSFIEHIKDCKVVCENLKKFIAPLASKTVKGAE